VARVLIADDSAAFRTLAARLLRAHGHEVVGEAGDARSAIRLVRAGGPDAVLLDVHFGAADGWSLARTLTAPDPHPRVIMTSSDPAAGSPALLRYSRAERFVAKADLLTHGFGGLLV
jgi:DNA-binding NarL/FixJ family response regulator